MVVKLAIYLHPVARLTMPGAVYPFLHVCYVYMWGLRVFMQANLCKVSEKFKLLTSVSPC